MGASKTQEYSNALYAHMLENSEEVVLDGKVILRWRGSLTKTCRELGIPEGVDSRVIRPLEAMGCIQILQRGVRNYPTVIALLETPTADRWENRHEGALTSRPSLDRLAREVREIQRTLGGVALGKVLESFDQRIQSIEADVKKLKESD